jgi:hypothetical protein
MRIIGCDLHARQQSLAMLDTQTGESDLKLIIANAARDVERHVKEVVFLESQIKTLTEGIRKSSDAELRVLANKVVLNLKQHARENELKNLKAATTK